MNKHRNLAAIAALSVAVGAPAVASADSGFYLGLSGGLNFQNELDGSFEGNFPDGAGGTAEFSEGFALSGTAGYQYDLQPNQDSLVLRPELEVSYRQNSVDSFRQVGGNLLGTFTDVDGDVSTLSGMANLWLDYEIGKFTPYVGGGIGLAQVSANGLSYAGANVDLVDDDDTVFAYQIGAGAAYSVTESVALTVDYRYFATSTAAFQVNPNIGLPDQDFEGDTSSHTTMIGVRYSF